MDRATFMKLIEEKKITNQGNKVVDSTQGRWFSYSAVKDSLREVLTAEDLEKIEKILLDESLVR
jgi:GTP:adenosylcobinamide-phosphate guanylyltransferase